LQSWDAVKYSRQRELVEQAVKASYNHPTAAEVYETLRSRIPNISLGTVYRNLSILSDNGRLLRLPMPDTGDRFDGNLAEHSHVVCETCGKVVDVDITLSEEARERIKGSTGVTVSHGGIVISGLCDECAKL
jgi:Fur family peroxide stress response transcriptional regulator